MKNMPLNDKKSTTEAKDNSDNSSDNSISPERSASDDTQAAEEAKIAASSSLSSSSQLTNWKKEVTDKNNYRYTNGKDWIKVEKGWMDFKTTSSIKLTTDEKMQLLERETRRNTYCYYQLDNDTVVYESYSLSEAVFLGEVNPMQIESYMIPRTNYLNAVLQKVDFPGELYSLLRANNDIPSFTLENIGFTSNPDSISGQSLTQITKAMQYVDSTVKIKPFAASRSGDRAVLDDNSMKNLTEIRNNIKSSLGKFDRQKRQNPKELVDVDRELLYFLKQAHTTAHTGAGNCGEQAILTAAKLLAEGIDGVKISELPNHTFLVIGDQIVDPWLNKVFPVDEKQAYFEELAKELNVPYEELIQQHVQERLTTDLEQFDTTIEYFLTEIQKGIESESDWTTHFEEYKLIYAINEKVNALMVAKGRKPKNQEELNTQQTSEELKDEGDLNTQHATERKALDENKEQICTSIELMVQYLEEIKLKINELNDLPQETVGHLELGEVLEPISTQQAKFNDLKNDIEQNDLNIVAINRRLDRIGTDVKESMETLSRIKPVKGLIERVLNSLAKLIGMSGYASNNTRQFKNKKQELKNMKEEYEEISNTLNERNESGPSPTIK